MAKEVKATEVSAVADRKTDLIELTNQGATVWAHPTQVALWKAQGWVEA